MSLITVSEYLQINGGSLCPVAEINVPAKRSNGPRISLSLSLSVVVRRGGGTRVGKRFVVRRGGVARQLACKNFAFFRLSTLDAARYNGVFRGIFGRLEKKERGGREGDWFSSKDSGLIRFETCIVRPFVYTQIRVHTDIRDGMESWPISVCTLRHRPIIISI